MSVPWGHIRKSFSEALRQQESESLQFKTSILPIKPKRKVTTVHRIRLFAEQKRRCAFCGRFCKWVGSGSDNTLFTVEHIFPRRFGGGNQPKNLIGACYKCNIRRGREIDLSQHTNKFKAVRLQEQIKWSIVRKME